MAWHHHLHSLETSVEFYGGSVQPFTVAFLLIGTRTRFIQHPNPVSSVVLLCFITSLPLVFHGMKRHVTARSELGL